MTLKISTALRNLACDALVDHFEIDTGAALIKFFDGTQPSDPQTALSSNTIVATITLEDPAFGNSGASNPGEAIAVNLSAQGANVVASLTPTFVRIYSADAADPADALLDADVAQGSGTFNFDNTTFINGGTATLTDGTFKITVPE